MEVYYTEKQWQQNMYVEQDKCLQVNDMCFNLFALPAIKLSIHWIMIVLTEDNLKWTW